MSNIEHLKPPANSDGALVKIAHICDGMTDMLERLEKHRDKLRGVDRSKLNEMPREMSGAGLIANIDTIARLLAKLDTTLGDIEAIF
jgi:hypothetical protein